MPLTLRSDIIQTFRDRIHKETHFRLSTDELQALINGFIVELQGAKTEKKIRALCEAEIKLLEEGYPQPSVAKYLSKYRKAIAIAIEDGKLPLTKATSHHYIHQQRVTGIEEKRHEHWALTYLKYSQEVYESIDKRPQPTAPEEPLNLGLVPVQPYLALLRGFLEKKGRFEARWLATAIAGVTGNRFSQTIATGKFSLTEHPYLLRYEKRVKTKPNYDDTNEIVTLFPAAEVLEAIGRLRKLPEIKAIAKLRGLNRTNAISDFENRLNATCSKELMQVVPPLQGKKAVSVLNLRSLYGAITVHFFCPELQRESDFIGRFLGHVIDSPAVGQYFRYALCDDQGALLRSKGVLLDQVPELLIAAPEQDAVGEMDDKPLPLALELEQLLTEAEAVEKAEAKPKRGGRRKTQVDVAAVVAAVPDEVADEATAEPQKISDDLRTELEKQIEQMRAEFEAQIKELRQESNVGWFVRRVEGLERENLALRIERDKAIAAMPKTDDTEVVRLKQENEAIALELKQAQDKLDGFRRLLNGGDAEATAAESEDAIVQQETADVVAVVEQVPAAVEKEGARAFVPQNAWTGRARAETETGAKRGPKGGRAFKRAEAIFLAVKDWNRLNPFETFAFNAGILETVFKVHRQAAKDFFEAYQNELWEYHQEIGVESPKWHNRGKDTEKLRTFVVGQFAD